jgi:GNAT superfamily N-acetyltransferase
MQRALILFLFCISYFSFAGTEASDFKGLYYSGQLKDEYKLTITTANKIKKNRLEKGILDINHGNEWDQDNERIFKTLNENLSTTFIAKVGKKIVGYVIVSSDRNFLSCLAIHPKFQKKGIGTKLLDQAFVKAKKLNFDTLSWNYRANKKELDQFYQKYLTNRQIAYDIIIQPPYNNGDEKNKIVAVIEIIKN